MELAKIEALIDLYFEGETTLAQEATLQEYFSGNTTVAPHLEMYRAIFNGIVNARKELLQKKVTLPQKAFKIKPVWYSIAAMLVVALTIAGFLWNQPASLSHDEKEAIAAFKETKNALDLLSKNFNKGAEELAYIHQFTKSKNKILK